MTDGVEVLLALVVTGHRAAGDPDIRARAGFQFHGDDEIVFADALVQRAEFHIHIAGIQQNSAVRHAAHTHLSVRIELPDALHLAVE